MNNDDRFRANRIQNGYYGSSEGSSRSGSFNRGEPEWRRSQQEDARGHGTRDWDYGGQSYGGESRWNRDDEMSLSDYDYGGGERYRDYGGYGPRYGMSPSDMGLGRRDWSRQGMWQRDRGRQDFGFGRHEDMGIRPQEQGYGGYGYERSRDFGGDDRRYERMSGRGMAGMPGMGRMGIAGGPEGREGRDFWDNARDRMNEGWERVKESFSGKGPKGYTRSDERIKEDVCDLLSRHHEIDASEIEVSVKDGDVMLDGQVRDRRTKRLAEDVIDDIHGVKEVLNRLRVARGTGSSIGIGTSVGGSVPGNGRTNLEGSSRNATGR
jgi:hypothetical protein